MHPDLFQIGGLRVTWYGVMMATGFSAGLATWYFLGRRENRDFSYCSDLLFWIMISGILGARIVYVFLNINWFAQHPGEIIKIWQGGLVYYGGFLGAGLGLMIFARRHNEDIRDLLDFVIVSVPLGHFFGRIGCFLNGCCHGRICEEFFCVRYPAGSYAWIKQVYAGLIPSVSDKSLPVYPVQLLESGFNLILYFILLWVYTHRNRSRSGKILALYCLTYPVGRFMLEFLRGDHEVFVFGFTIAQVTSMFLIVLGIAVWLFPGMGNVRKNTAE